MSKELIIQEIFTAIDKHFSVAERSLKSIIEQLKQEGKGEEAEADACKIKYNNHRKGETPEIKALALYIVYHLDDIKGSLTKEQLFTLVNFLTLSANYYEQKKIGNANESVEQIQQQIRTRMEAALICLDLSGTDITLLTSQEASSVEKGFYLDREFKRHEIEIIAQFFVYYGKFSRYSNQSHPGLEDSERLFYVTAGQQIADWIEHEVLSFVSSLILYYIFSDLKRVEDATQLMIDRYQRAKNNNRSFDMALCGCRAINGLMTAYDQSPLETLKDQADTLSGELDAMVSDQNPVGRENLYRKLPYYNFKVEQVRIQLIRFNKLKNSEPETAQSTLDNALELWNQHFAAYDPTGQKKSGFSNTEVKPSHIIDVINLFSKYASLTNDMTEHQTLLKAPKESSPTIKKSKWDVAKGIVPLVSTQEGNGPVPSVWLEVLDPQHRPWKTLYSEWKEWGASNTYSFFKFLENKPTKDTVTYSKVFGERFEITIIDGLAYRANDLKLLKDHLYKDIRPALFDTMAYQGKLERPRTSGFAVFILDAKTKTLYGVPYTSDKVHHTSCTDGSRTLSAGMMKFKEGRLIGIYLTSGHYKPTGRELYNILCYLHKQGVDLGKINPDGNLDLNTIPLIESEFLNRDFIINMLYRIVTNNPVQFKIDCKYIGTREIVKQAYDHENSVQSAGELVYLHRVTGLPVTELALGLDASKLDDETKDLIKNKLKRLKEEYSTLYTKFSFGLDLKSHPHFKEFNDIYFKVHDRFGTFKFSTPRNLRSELREPIVSVCAAKEFIKSNFMKQLQSDNVAPIDDELEQTGMKPV